MFDVLLQGVGIGRGNLVSSEKKFQTHYRSTPRLNI